LSPPNNRSNENYFSGLIAEGQAEEILVRRGFCILERRYQAIRGATEGEIDLIARRNNLVVFVEVKKRATIALAAESVTSRQQQRLYRAAETYIAAHPALSSCDCRFDAVLFDAQMKVEYLENAW